MIKHTKLDEVAGHDLGPAPILSTPDSHILNQVPATLTSSGDRLSDEEFYIRYEIERTLKQIKERSWKRVALQFPDEMLADSTRVHQLLARGLHSSTTHHNSVDSSAMNEPVEPSASRSKAGTAVEKVKLTILADTSFGSCCVDEIAAEHVEADAVVHYGRACLSPTVRLPVLHIFTREPLNSKKVVGSFEETFPDKLTRVILTADLPFSHHVPELYKLFIDLGYKSIYMAEIVHDPASPIPNRTVPEDMREDAAELKKWRLFHVSKPPSALLLTLSSRLSEIRIYPTDYQSLETRSTPRSVAANSSLILRRRYGLVTSLATVPIWGILINTLSVKDYLHVVEQVKSQIKAAGKKSYLFVVGKLNAAKVANFSEIGGWVVIGCWESSLVDSQDFYKPVVTPFELEMSLKRDDQRIWNGDWSADFQRILGGSQLNGHESESMSDKDSHDGDWGLEEESLPPEFDLRTGRYVSQARPMRRGAKSTAESSKALPGSSSSALTTRSKGDVVAVNGVASPAAEFLRSKRTWAGLGSDFNIGYEEDGENKSDVVKEGRAGIARGYVVGVEDKRT